jgi:uncharacterized protein (DUF924 family)
MTTIAQAERILNYWFDLGWEEDPRFRSEWFEADSNFDAAIRERFVGLHAQAMQNQMLHWYEEPKTCLALIVLLDQFSRNMFRGTAAAFASDAMALMVADHALNLDFDLEFDLLYRFFFYLPFEHSEAPENQAIAVDRMQQYQGHPTLNLVYDYACQHQAVIQQFGRFPHRNAILGRVSTPEELDYLARSPGF